MSTSNNSSVQIRDMTSIDIVTPPEFINCDSDLFPRPRNVCACSALVHSSVPVICPQCEQICTQTPTTRHLYDMTIKKEPQDDKNNITPLEEFNIKEERVASPTPEICRLTDFTDYPPPSPILTYSPIDSQDPTSRNTSISPIIDSNVPTNLPIWIPTSNFSNFDPKIFSSYVPLSRIDIPQSSPYFGSLWSTEKQSTPLESSSSSSKWEENTENITSPISRSSLEEVKSSTSYCQTHVVSSFKKSRKKTKKRKSKQDNRDVANLGISYKYLSPSNKLISRMRKALLKISDPERLAPPAKLPSLGENVQRQNADSERELAAKQLELLDSPSGVGVDCVTSLETCPTSTTSAVGGPDSSLSDSLSLPGQQQTQANQDPKVTPPVKKRRFMTPRRYPKFYPADFKEICPYCGKIFTGPRIAVGRLNVHLKNVHLERVTLSCLHCTYSTTTKENLRKHMLRHTGEKPFKCHICGMGFALSGRRNRHINDKHTKAKKFDCKLCAYTTTQRYNLIAHLRKHSGERPFSCEICSEDFAHLGTKKQHMRDVHKMDIKKRISRRGEGIRRNKRVSKSKVQEYVQLEKKRGQSTSKVVVKNKRVTIKDVRMKSKCIKLSKNIKSNNSEAKSIKKQSKNKLLCELCSFSTVFKSKLRKHMQQHIKNAVIEKERMSKPTLYGCPHCHYLANSQNGMYSHIRAHIKNNQLNDKEETYANRLEPTVITCPFCQMVLDSQEDVEKHIMNNHKNQKTYKCLFCKATVYKLYMLKHHYHTYHANACYNCGFCDFISPTRSNFLEHMRVHMKKTNSTKQIENCMYFETVEKMV